MKNLNRRQISEVEPRCNIETNGDDTSSQSPLPQGWAKIQAKKVLRLFNGFAFKPSHWKGHGLPIIRIQNLNNAGAAFNFCPDQNPERYRVRNGDLLFAWSGTPGTSFGAHIWRGGDAWLNQHIFRVDFDEGTFDKEFLRLAINRNLDDYIRQAQGGVGLAHITKGKFEESFLIMPPVAEQKQIVAKIEELLPKVNAVRERLIRVKGIMRRFRQSVLSAACSGTLSAGWREAHPKVQTASELIKQAQLEEKRLYTEESQNAKRTGKGKPRIPSILQLEEIDRHPEIETWATLAMHRAFPPDGLFDGPFGSNLKTSDYTKSGIRVVRIENVGFLTFLEDKRTYISPEKYEALKRHTVGEGDLIFASFISEGVRAVVLPKMEKAIAKADCFCLRPLPQLLDCRYLAIILSSRQIYSELVEVIHGATRPRITTKQLRNLNIPLAPLEEQREIAFRVESLFKIAETIEKQVKAELLKGEKMTQAILAKAFRGELVL
jgi:type I restriction enzyme S subunit